MIASLAFAPMVAAVLFSNDDSNPVGFGPGQGPGTVVELTAASSYATAINFTTTGAGFAVPSSLAIDAAGNVFAANEDGPTVSPTGSVSELIGLASPVLTPVQACLQQGRMFACHDRGWGARSLIADGRRLTIADRP